MAWWNRNKEGIQTSTEDKKEAPDGLWFKCPECKTTLPAKVHKENLSLCPKCEFHSNLSAQEYFDLIYDDNSRYKEIFTEVKPMDFLEFKDQKSYASRLTETKKKTGLSDAMRVAHGKIDGEKLVIACMDFAFIGGSMGSVVGEKISLAIDFCIEKKYPLLIISKSGGARMMESAFSLMQMAKTSAKLAVLAQHKIPYISLMTNPTTGGVSASYAMLGDLNIAEPRALIGFAGPRVIKETIKKDLPKGFQTSEFLLEHGFLDFIVHRKELKNQLAKVLSILRNKS